MKLDKYLVLSKYFISLLGYEDFYQLRGKMKDDTVGFENNGRSYFVDTLIGNENLKIPYNELLKYDEAIKEYSDRLNRNRGQFISLKYFQYLAVLFCEIFLDRYFNKKEQFLREINQFLEKYSQLENIRLSPFSDKDIKKIAYYMATGSGKTLIMHINYWQFLKYTNEKIDNIILITPNEGMSKQHYNEMIESGISAIKYEGNLDYKGLGISKDVFILDIYKLTGEKKGEGKKIETSYFEGKNLVFIDEGHKGQSTIEQTWKKLREELGKDGFVFEYSATFAQVISEKDTDLIDEYSKAIIFDYSYKYFYQDGYGKDFYVYSHSNDKKNVDNNNYSDIILTANLLSFYEQLLLYENFKEKLYEYNIEKPLWIFVGSTVIGKKSNLSKDEKTTISDVLRVVKFLDNIMRDENFLKGNIDKVLKGTTGLTREGRDIFEDRFSYLRENGFDIEDIYTKIFYGRGNLSIFDIKSADGEIGLKAGGSYFGVINIGEDTNFEKSLNERNFEIQQDSTFNSLFESIDKNTSSINILIGAKKFMEGWNSWRVSSMGLINIGKGEGSQIIQLFGRGVRLKGKNFSLKRSKEKEYYINALETLNIFGLNADYISKFLESLNKEWEYEEIIKLPIKKLEEEQWESLWILDNNNFDFLEYSIEGPLGIEEDILNKIKIDLRPEVRIAHGLNTTLAEREEKKLDLSNYVDIIDWDEIYTEILNYKTQKRYFNLRIDKDILKEIVQTQKYEIYVLSQDTAITNFSDIKKIKEDTLLLLKTYIDKFYNFKSRQKETESLKPIHLVKENENLKEEYILKISIPTDNTTDSPVERERIKKERERIKKEIKKIKELIKNINQFYERDIDEIPTLHFDRHLYTPLTIYNEHKKHIHSEPEKLNEGETEFIRLLRNYVQENKIKDKEIYLLRNLSKRGVNFFQTSGYYPDFIMWVKEQNEQTIVFIDPKGTRNLGPLDTDEKIQLHRYLKEKVQPKIKEKYPEINLDSFILSITPYSEEKRLKGNTKKEFEANNVLFLKDDKEEAIEKLFEKIKS
ncbi:MAG: Type III restriction enzyme, res subunit [Candidatus Diapherotrites archaeon ADurb.Bin253]|nr:MAG: Type III restriction enzyme, res subunit [Candidatus Diapherotrites archaeon ADurb.Bin253]